MLSALLKVAAPLMLWTALFFLTGVTATAGSIALGTAADLCCPQETGDREPAPDAPEGECADPACGCLSCTASLLAQELNVPGSAAGMTTGWSTPRQSIPAPPGRSIDYPPESA